MLFKKKNRASEETLTQKPKEKSPYSILRWKNMKQATSEDEAKFREQMQENQVSWKDGCAMTLAAFLVIVLPVSLILIGVCLLVMWGFGAFS